jgi:hypothetical protein
VLTSEAVLGYPYHLWLAVGNLSEAEDEAASEYPDLAARIRSVRLALMGQVQENGENRPFYHDDDRNDLMDLLMEARKLASEKNGIDEETRICNVFYPPQEVPKLKVVEHR